MLVATTEQFVEWEAPFTLLATRLLRAVVLAAKVSVASVKSAIFELRA